MGKTVINSYEEAGITANDWKKLLPTLSNDQFLALVMFCRMPNHRGSCKSTSMAYDKSLAANQLNRYISVIGEKMAAQKDVILQSAGGSQNCWAFLMKDHQMEKGLLLTTLRSEVVEAVQDRLLDLLIERYKMCHRQSPFNGYEEVYKWKIIDECQGKDELTILQKFFNPPYNNLIYKLIVSTLKQLMDSHPTELKAIVGNLYDDTQPLGVRLQEFCRAMDAITPEKSSKPGDERTAATLLTCHDSEKYTFFMAEKIYAPFCNYLGVSKETGQFKKYPHFLELLKPLVEKIAHDDELKEMIEQQTKNNHQSHLLTAQTILWCLHPEFDDIIKIGNMAEYHRFRQLLEYFVAHLEYCNNGNDTSSRGFDQYIKSWVDTQSFKCSGQGYNGGQIQQQVKDWEQYPAGKIFINVYASDYTNKGNYLNWENTSINITANWKADVIESLSLTLYSEETKSRESLLTFSTAELGLFDDSSITESLIHLYTDYCSYKLKDPMTTSEFSDYIILLKGAKNLVLTGAPGTGKTFLANQIAECMGAETAFVQFHPSYDYTDFVEGLRPVKNEEGSSIGFERMDGEFKDFCKKAIQNLEDSRKTPEVLARELTLSEAYDALIEDIEDGRVSSIPQRTGVSLDIVEVSDRRCIILRTHGTSKLYTISLSRLQKLHAAFPDIAALDGMKNLHKEITTAIGGCHSSSYWGMLHLLYERMEEGKTEESVGEAVQEKSFVFIIDEINRGEVSKIFGELFFAIDPGYRGKQKRMPKTQYQNLIDSDDEFAEGFYVPENVYIIGTMNDIDRSVESMDFAMRRRFAWKEITVEETQSMLDDEGAWEYDKPDPAVLDEIKARMDNLNDAIIDKYHEDDYSSKERIGLSKAYQIGASYFLKYRLYNDFEALWNNHLRSLLYEYLRGSSNIERKIEILKSAYDDKTRP